MQPVIFHRGATYKTKSNRRIREKTKYGYVDTLVGKSGKVHRCHQCNKYLLSISRERKCHFARLPLSQRRVKRPYGATHCGKCVSEKILSSFLNEEERCLVSKDN